jgi:hypothetical protein
MSDAERSFGILTLATPNDFLKAIGLALSLRVSNPGVPVAVACSPSVRPLVEPYFDEVVTEQAGLKGFVHKVYLDKYSPFEETLFFDSDVLVFKPVRPYVDRWGSGPYYACGHYRSDGRSSFGMDRRSVLKKLGKDRLVVIDGAGHAFFRKPSCERVFELAREISLHHKDYVGDIPYADEDVIDIAMTQLDLPPAPFDDFFARYLSAQPGTMKMDAAKGVCHFIAVYNGQPFAPCMVHFAANEAPFHYTRQLFSLFRKFDVPTSGLFFQGASDIYQNEIRMALSSKLRSLKRIMGAK